MPQTLGERPAKGIAGALGDHDHADVGDQPGGALRPLADRPRLRAWTAFVVIAGSSGETLRRIVMRIAGTLAGASARTPLAGKGGEVGAVAAAVSRLARAVDAEREEGRDPAGPVAAAVAGRIRANIAALARGAGDAHPRFSASLSDLLDPGAAASAVARLATDGAPGAGAGFGDGILSVLVEIHTGIVELAGGPGITAASAPSASAASDQPREPS